MGVTVTPFASYDQALAVIEHWVDTGRKSFWVAINPQKIYRAWNDKKLMAVLARADVGICDGVGCSVASKIIYGQGIQRCTGCDLFFQLLPLAARKGWGVFLLGASAEANRVAAGNLQARYPGLWIAGRRDGFFKDSADVVRDINDSGATLLFVAMGTPKQEYWIAEHMEQCQALFYLGVGGSLNVASGMVKRAPTLFQRTGTEFLYQLVHEPWRFRRQMAYAPFLLEVLRTKVLGTREYL